MKTYHQVLPRKEKIEHFKEFALYKVEESETILIYLRESKNGTFEFPFLIEFEL